MAGPCLIRRLHSNRIIQAIGIASDLFKCGFAMLRCSGRANARDTRPYYSNHCRVIWQPTKKGKNSVCKDSFLAKDFGAASSRETAFSEGGPRMPQLPY